MSFRGKANNFRPLLKSEVETAQLNTKSAASAAKYLRVSYKTYVKYAKMYDIFKTNPSGKGITKSRRGVPNGLNKILRGENPYYSKRKLKERLLRSGIMNNSCYLCGFDQQRITDGKVPLVLYSLDGDQRNYKRENLEMRCYNCAFLTSEIHGGSYTEQLLNKKPVHELDSGVFERDLRERIKTEGENIDLETIHEEVRRELTNIGE